MMIAFPLMWGGNPVFAETSINTTVCGVDAQASVSVNAPLSDSIVNSTTFVVEGDVKHSNQIDVTLDGQYDQTVALRSSQTSYSFTVQTTPGTHTIRVNAYGVCGGGAVAETIFTIPASPSSRQLTDEENEAKNVKTIEPLTVLEGQLLEVATIQDTDRFFEQNGFTDVAGFSTQQSETSVSVASVVSIARQYTSSIVFIASALAIISVTIPIQAGAAATSLFGVPRRILISIAIIGIISAVFLGI